ncbi:conjugative transposon protein TraM [Fibrivirga algicola]|jgi:conjugative transposon TraM protein|uniref:Conjugative transposon protein TraM n=1 Tax=Fibrivirga algicola TaxID=2950420 RepID=A0ABX0QPE5_9BACT|nr:conjugative transposon protein TraM [Fibrivirga algicola]NID13658.1 conjugative transposon protein TraM [Fibrivirga algicola]
MNPLEQPQNNPFFDTPIEEQPAPGSETVQKGKIGRKQILLLFGGFAFLLGVAIFGFMGSFISSDTANQTAQTPDGGASALAPPEARPHNLDAKEKYDKYGFDAGTLNPTQSSAIDRQAAAGTQLLTGKDPSMTRATNEMLTDADINAIRKQAGQTTQPYLTATERKSAQHNQLKRQFDHQQAERDVIYRTMHRSAKGREQLAEERTAKRQRDLDQQTADVLLRQIDRANQRMTTGTSGNGLPSATEPLHLNEYRELKAKYGGELPPSYRTLFKREIAAEEGTADQEDVATEPALSIRSTGAPERKAMNLSNAGFYGLSTTVAKSAANPSPTASSIPAVVHGDGDAVTVQNGSTLNLRLLEETTLRLNGALVKLPAHTLLAGTCSISADRVNVTVTSVRLGSDIYPVRLTAYDLDGRAGLSVPKLADKNRVAQGLGTSAGQAVSSPYYFVPQGSFGQQVGSQLAMQVTNTAFQGIRSLVQSKLTAVKVTVKPNYRIFLRAEQATAGYSH